MSKLFFIQVILLGLFLAGCAANTSDKHAFGWSVAATGCTSAHYYPSLKEECQNLQDEAVSDGCAQDQRIYKFVQDCPGQTFTPVNSKAPVSTAPASSATGAPADGAGSAAAPAAAGT